MSNSKASTPARGDAAELAQFGYKQSMARHTGKFASFAVAFAFVSITTGIFTTYGLFRDASFEDAWLYVIVMVVIGAGYLGYLLARRGSHGLAMPDQHSIDAVLDQEAGTQQP